MSRVNSKRSINSAAHRVQRSYLLICGLDCWLHSWPQCLRVWEFARKLSWSISSTCAEELWVEIVLIVAKFYGQYHASSLFLYCRIEQTVIRSSYQPSKDLMLRKTAESNDWGRKSLFFFSALPCLARKALLSECVPFGRLSFPLSIR